MAFSKTHRRHCWRPPAARPSRKNPTQSPRLIEEFIVPASDLHKLSRQRRRERADMQDQPIMLPADRRVPDNSGIKDPARHDLPKKNFRRGGSCPPPEVRHGWQAVVLNSWADGDPTVSVTIPMPKATVNSTNPHPRKNYRIYNYSINMLLRYDKPQPVVCKSRHALAIVSPGFRAGGHCRYTLPMSSDTPTP